MAIAANFTRPMQTIASEFENETGHKVIATHGATSTIYAQSENDGLFEILLTLDREMPAALVKEGANATEPSSPTSLASWYLWSDKSDVVYGAGEVQIQGGSHIVLAEPRLVPCGTADVELTEPQEVYDSPQARFATAEHISQGQQFFSRGHMLSSVSAALSTHY